MVDTSTTYLGHRIRTPLIASASPLSETVDGLRALEEAGVGAIVLSSMFEEQLDLSPETLHRLMGENAGGYARVLGEQNGNPRTKRGPLEYLEHLRAAKAAVEVPIIASVNGTPGGSWPCYLPLLAEAGADAVEINLYHVPTDPMVSGADLEASYFDAVRRARDHFRAPIAVKLHPFFTSIPHAALRLHECGADALVLFNRFYQPDVDIETLEAKPRLLLSSPEQLRLPLRWIGILHGRVGAELALSGGVHSGEDVLKALAVGAQAVMLCSTLLRHGIHHLASLDKRLSIWLEAHDYPSVDALRGRLVTDGEASAIVHRAQYIRTLFGYDHQ